MREMTFRGFQYGAGEAVLDRRLRASDLPQPTTNREADRTTADKVAAHHRALLRVSGFGDATDPVTGAAVAAGGGAASGFELGLGSDVGRAMLVGIGVTVGATLAIRLIDSMWRKR